MIDPLVRFVRLLWRALRRFTADHGPNHAAAVAYFSLLSLPPFLLLAGRALARVLPVTDGTDAILSAVAPFLPLEIAPALRALARSIRPGGALVAVAVPVLLWVASHAFSSLEVAVNVAFGTTPQRRFWLSRLKAFAGLSGGVLLLGGTLLAGHLASWLDHYYVRTGAPPYLSPRAHLISSLALLAVTYVVFTLFYKWLPSGKVGWSSATRAAAVAVVLWEGARHAFGGLLAGSPAFGLFSGALAGIVAVLGWIYVAVAVTIYGAEVAALLNGTRAQNSIGGVDPLAQPRSTNS
jgi:membrane protein